MRVEKNRLGVEELRGKRDRGISWKLHTVQMARASSANTGEFSLCMRQYHQHTLLSTSYRLRTMLGVGDIGNKCHSPIRYGIPVSVR